MLFCSVSTLKIRRNYLSIGRSCPELMHSIQIVLGYGVSR